MPCLCVTLACAVQKTGLHILQGARCVCPNGPLTNECKERQPTVIFTVSPDAPFSATRKSSHTNMRCTRPPSTSLIFPPPNVDNRRVRQKNRLRVVYIPSASSVMNASSVTKNCTITCDIHTKNVLYASETKLGTNSKPHSRPSLRH